IVWEELVSFTGGQTWPITPNFTGQLGEDYTLAFNRVSETYNSNGRHGIDNLSFNQVPEPSTAGLLGLAAVGLLSRRQSRTRSAA
ncbi:MAG: PEP-CTERM sorting domain-containing protein, partial [Chthoniobacteraceae bacterium]